MAEQTAATDVHVALRGRVMVGRANIAGLVIGFIMMAALPPAQYPWVYWLGTGFVIIAVVVDLMADEMGWLIGWVMFSVMLALVA